MAIYSKMRRQFLKDHTRCAVYLELHSDDIHHMRGRLGTLLIDQRFWLAVSRKGHDYIHRNPNLARTLGYTCERGLWNVAPKDEETARLKLLLVGG